MVGPAHDVFPGVVALAHGGRERLLGNDLRQHDVGARIGEQHARAVKPRRVGGIGIAAAGIVGLERLVHRGEGHGFQRHVICAEIIRQIELRGGALLHADRGVVELERRAHLEHLAHHKTLAVVIGDGGKIDAQRGVARHGPGGVAGQHIDLARLQRREAIGGSERHELDFGRVVEDRRRDGAAEIDVKTGPVALRIGDAEAGQ